MSAPLVVDLSHHNTVRSFADLKAGGTVGVIHKASQGTKFSDPDYWDRREAAHDEGLAWSSYHFLEHGNVEAQMQNFLNIVCPVAGERLIIDHESVDGQPPPTIDDLEEAIERLLDMAPDRELTVYSGHLIKEQLGNAFDQLLSEHTSLWIAHYTDAAQPTWPKATWHTWSLWQYTDKAEVPGIKAPTDANRFNGSAAQCLKWIGPPPLVPVIPEDEIVRIDVRLPEGVALQMTVNGVPMLPADENGGSDDD